MAAPERCAPESERPTQQSASGRTHAATARQGSSWPRLRPGKAVAAQRRRGTDRRQAHTRSPARRRRRRRRHARSHAARLSAPCLDGLRAALEPLREGRRQLRRHQQARRGGADLAVGPERAKLRRGAEQEAGKGGRWGGDGQGRTGKAAQPAGRLARSRQPTAPPHHGPLDRLVHLGVLEHDQAGLATQLQATREGERVEVTGGEEERRRAGWLHEGTRCVTRRVRQGAGSPLTAAPGPHNTRLASQHTAQHAACKRPAGRCSEPPRLGCASHGLTWRGGCWRRLPAPRCGPWRRCL